MSSSIDGHELNNIKKELYKYKAKQDSISSQLEKLIDELAQCIADIKRKYKSLDKKVSECEYSIITIIKDIVVIKQQN